jgi:single-strand DNA-binding protein
MRDVCRWCGSIDLQETIMDHGPHYSRLDCNDCGKFVKWGKKPASAVPAEPDSTKESNKYTGGFGMNKVILAGRLTKDPELRYTTNNTPVCSFTLAVDRRFKQENGPQADFIPIIAWQKTGEFCSKYFSKGRKIIVAGRIETRTWDDNEGKKHYVTEVIAEEVDFADSKKDDNGSSALPSDPPATEPPAAQPPKQQNSKSAGNKSSSGSKPSSPPPQAGERMPWEMG